MCAPRIQSGRAAELQELNRKHSEAGGGCYMATLTIPHDAGDKLRAMRRHVAWAWGRTIAGEPWKRWKARLGLLGTVRALETTHGPNGWHPHLHVALYTAAPLDDATLAEFRRWLYARWVTYIVRPSPSGERWRAPSEAHGVTVQPLRASEYLAKMGLAAELTLGTTKEGRDGHRTPWQILRDATLNREEDERAEVQGIRDRRLWREWARAMRGARQLTYSRGLLARYGIREAEDAELPDTQLDLETLAENDSETVYTFSEEEWRDVLAGGVRLRLELLDVPKLPREEWGDAIVRLLDAARGLDPVPF